MENILMLLMILYETPCEPPKLDIKKYNKYEKYNKDRDDVNV